MSADDYYTIKFDPVGLKWYALHGFMSGLEDGVPALLWEGQTGHDNWESAALEAGEEISEYGVIQEPSPLDEILAVDQWRDHLEDTIRLAKDHLAWINGDDAQ